jgi:DNA polymerase III epsilon subunit-like protein
MEFIIGAAVFYLLFMIIKKVIKNNSSPADVDANAGRSGYEPRYRYESRPRSRNTINDMYSRPDVAVNTPYVKPQDLEFKKSTTGIRSIAVFDTETTGLPSRKKATQNNCASFPRIVQIAWMIFDKDLKIIKQQSYIVKQEKKIPKTSIQIHGITDEIAQNKGVDIEIALNEFLSDIEKCDVLVAHNVEFDYNVLKSEIYRNGLDAFSIERIHKFCTMRASTDFCAIERYGGGYKYPTLKELYSKCFPSKILSEEMLHNALTDVAVCAKSLEKLHELNAI